MINRICFIPASYERLSIRIKQNHAPDHADTRSVVPFSNHTGYQHRVNGALLIFRSADPPAT